ncbi:hypothetical protein V6N13_101633 [Hibiscus sabdariffa]|uniref:H15 domain-containing protein n=1 Tax=Hibiscus sabdariffa TaxID=183260 RepID=A0ABR2QLY3_9ROSI
MIRQAILKLNEECGSTEEAILRHLEKEYRLPWGHASFLSHYLRKLCCNGEIVCADNERYMINVDNGNVGNAKKGDPALVGGKGSEVEAVDGWSGVNGDQNPWEVEEQSAKASALITAREQRMEAGRETVNEVQEEGLNFSGQIEVGHQFKTPCGNGEIVSGNNEQYMVQVNDGDFGNEEMSHGLNVSNSDEKEDQTLFQVKGREFKAIDGWDGVNSDQAVESEDQCEQRTEGLKEQKEGRKEPLKEVQEESQNLRAQIEVSHHLEKHGEIDCANKEHFMVQVDVGDLEKEDEEMSHGLGISDRDDMEYQALIQVEGREVETIDGCNGVNGDQAAESVNRCEVERISVEATDQNKACEQGMEEFEEQNDGRRESLKKVQEDCRNLSGQIEVAAEGDAAKGKRTKVIQKQRGQKRKRQKKTKRQIKVLKNDTPRPIMEDEKKDAEERQQQIKGGSGLTKSAGKQERPRRGKMVSEEVHPPDQEIDIRTEMRVLPCDRDVKILKNSILKRSDRLLEKQKKEALKHEELMKRKLCDRKRDLFIVCALPASQSRTNTDPKAHKRLTDSPSTSLESWESGEILLRQLKRSTPAKTRGLRRNTSKRFQMSKDLELEKQEQQFRKPQKLQEYEIKSKQANFGSEEAAVSPSIKVKDSTEQGNQMGPFIVCALPASSQSRTNINRKAHMPPTDSTSASLESSEFGEILLRQLKLSSSQKPRGLRRNTSKRFTQSEPKPDGMSKGLELDKQEQQFREPKKLPEDELKTKQPNFGGEEAMDQGHQMERIKLAKKQLFGGVCISHFNGVRTWYETLNVLISHLLMSGVSFAMAPRSELNHTVALGRKPEHKPLHQQLPQQQSDTGSIMGLNSN